MKKKTNNYRNAGRKPLADKKRLVRLYPRESIIEANGGEEECRKASEEFLIKRAKKLAKQNSVIHVI